jgi:putative DNA primase/helicase
MCGRKNKLRIDDKEGSGSWICVCGSGNGWKLLELTTGKDFKTLAHEIDQAFGNTFDGEYQAPKVNDRLATTVSRFRHIARLEGTDGELYLNSRGITQMPTGGVKFSREERHTDENRKYQAMYAIASNEYGEAVQRHLTYLDGTKKAEIERSKKMLSLQEYSGSIAVKLFPAASTLGIAEGIETALSAHQLYKMPVWSALNATLMKKFKAPPGVETLVIYADNDKNGTGLNAAFECGNKNLLSQNDVARVIIKWPELPDFNDMLLNGCKLYQWELTK